MLCDCTDESGLIFSYVFEYYTEQGDGSVVGRMGGVARLGMGVIVESFQSCGFSPCCEPSGSLKCQERTTPHGTRTTNYSQQYISLPSTN